MKSAIPIDASCAIYLAKADGLTAASAALGPMLMPPSVWFEVVVQGERRAAPELQSIRRSVAAGALVPGRLDKAEIALARRIAADFNLGAGESEVLALGRRSDVVLVDDHRATRAGRTLGILTLETLMIPVLCRERGTLDGREASLLLEQIALQMDVSAERMLRVRRRIEEVNT